MGTGLFDARIKELDDEDQKLYYGGVESFDVISVGDALIDAFLTIHESSSHLTLDKTTKQLCVGFGDKVQIDDCQFLLGGNACNVRV